MPRRTSKGTNEWAELLQQAATTRSVKPAGSGWLRWEEIQKRIKRGRNATYEFLAAQVKAGLVERFDATEPDGRGQLVRRVYYRKISK
jgi:hypothetical protein